MTKSGLTQYGNLVKEYAEVKEKIWANKRKLERIQRKLNAIEEEGVVKDKVYGGEGGVQGFVIEGYASGDYSYQKSLLQHQRLLVLNSQATLEELSIRIAQERCEIEQFIASVDDSHIRRILSYRLVKNMKWADIAIKMGGGNTEDGVKKAYQRFVDSHFE